MKISQVVIACFCIGFIACMSHTATPQPHTLNPIGIKNCEEMCEGYGANFNCKTGFGTCTSQWDSTWTQFCTMDVKYCSRYHWEQFCKDEVLQCRNNCTKSCLDCFRFNECYAKDNFAAICNTSCEQD